MVLVGQLTDQCVESAVRDACDLGYLVTVVTDACITHSEERHDNSLRTMKGYCRQRTTKEVIDEIGSNLRNQYQSSDSSTTDDDFHAKEKYIPSPIYGHRSNNKINNKKASRRLNSPKNDCNKVSKTITKANGNQSLKDHEILIPALWTCERLANQSISSSRHEKRGKGKRHHSGHSGKKETNLEPESPNKVQRVSLRSDDARSRRRSSLRSFNHA